MTDFLLMVGGALFAMLVSGIVNYRKSQWVGLTDEEIESIAKNYALNNPTTPLYFARAIEAKLKEKNYLSLSEKG